MNTNVATQTFTEETVFANHNLPPVVVTRAFKPDVGTHEIGQVLSRDANDLLVATVPHTEEFESSEFEAGIATNAAFPLDAPLAPGSVWVITDEAVPKILRDDGHGGLYGDGTGSVDYANGEVDMVFAIKPADGSTVTLSVYTRLGGVANRAVDTAKEPAATVVIFGPVRQHALKVEGAAPDEAVLEGLRHLGLFPL